MCDSTLLGELKNTLIQHFSVSEDKTENQESRSIFQREYDRVIFSDYFRSLSIKTQVVPSPENDHTHTRLTHSLEVASLGFDFAKKLLNKLLEVEDKKYNTGDSLTAEEREHRRILSHLPLCVATACLVHDIGNPPFGHSGEEAIQQFFVSNFAQCKHDSSYSYKNLSLTENEFKDLEFFDGNAYGFRVLTRLAGRRPENGDSLKSSGLGLSPVTLMSFCKYPFSAGNFPGNPKKRKFGFFCSEESFFLEIVTRLKMSPSKRHPLVYLVEASDDICYLIMDCEDAIKNGHFKFSELEDIFNLERYIRNKSIPGDFEDREKEVILQSISKIKNYDPNKPILLSELKALENIRAFLFRDLIQIAFNEYISNIDKVMAGDIGLNLLKESMKTLQRKEDFEKFEEKFLRNSLYTHTRKMTMELSGKKVLQDFLKKFLTSVSNYKTIGDFKCNSQYLI
jgi:dGTPase